VLLAVLGLGAAQLLAAVPSKSPAIGVTPGDVTDRRRNDNTFAGLEVELKLTGEAAGGARGARALVEKAVDDTGRNLVKEGGRPADFEKPSGQGSPGCRVPHGGFPGHRRVFHRLVSARSHRQYRLTTTEACSCRKAASAEVTGQSGRSAAPSALVVAG